MKKNTSTLSLFILFFITILFSCTSLKAQDVSQVVKSKIVYCCTEYHEVTDSFSTPDEAINHYIKLHMPEGYKLIAGTIEVFNNGNVNFQTNRNNSEEATQSGHVSGYVNCPPNASPLVESDAAFKDKKCLCDNGYKSIDDKCVLPPKITSSPAKPKTTGKTKGK